MKGTYRELCESEPSIPFFSQAWWWDALAGEDWDVALVEKGGQVVASMPYLTRKWLGFTILSHPDLTQTQGPWIRQTNAKYAKRLSREKDLMGALIEQLPEYDQFAQNWDHSQTNWLPFYWKGFSQTTRYTYRIEGLQTRSETEIWAGLQENIRTDIRKAANRAKLQVREDLPLEDFYRLNAMTFHRQGQQVPYDLSLVRALDRAAGERGCRRMLIAEDSEGRQHAGVYLVWDEDSAYYLLGGGDPELRGSGATSLCIWEAIKFASSVTRNFDFEGSMLEPVERVFRAFGAVQTPYHRINHTPSRMLRTARVVRGLLR